MVKRELCGVQYLRGIAAMLVVLSHISAQCTFPKYFNGEVFGGFFLAGTVGVELFFVISGFIITYVSLANYTLQPTLSTSSFLQKRFQRIVPFMWICIIGYALLKSLGRSSFPIMPYLRAIVLFPIGDIQPNVIWTLRHEFLFYSLFCMFGISLRKWAYLITWFLSPIIWFSFFSNELSFFVELGNFLFNKVNILFGMGFLLGIAYQKGLFIYLINTRFSFIWSLVLSIPLLLFAFVAGKDRIELTFNFAIISGLISTALLLFGVSLTPKKPMNYMDRVGLLLGDASYSIYLTHSAIISATLGIWSKFKPNANLVVVLITVFAACLIIGVVIHKWVEKPLISFVKYMTSYSVKKAIKVS